MINTESNQRIKVDADGDISLSDQDVIEHAGL